jgi:hypothetical protein
VPHYSSCDALRHIDAFVCLPHVDTLLCHRPRILRHASATLSAITTPPLQFPSVLQVLDSATDCRSNPIAHRVRRKRQRLPPSLLIENASDRDPPPPKKFAPRRFRSRLATNRELSHHVRGYPVVKQVFWLTRGATVSDSPPAATRSRASPSSGKSFAWPSHNPRRSLCRCCPRTSADCGRIAGTTCSAPAS